MLTPMPTSSPSAPHVETCGVHFPRVMSDAYAFEHPAAAMISDGHDRRPRSPTWR